MADEEEDLILDLNAPPPGETPPAKAAEAAPKPPPVPGPPPAAAPPAPAVTPQAGMQELQNQLLAERRERERLTQQARQMQSERDNAVRYARDAEQRDNVNAESYLDGQIQSIQEQMDTLSAQAETAMGDGDFKTAADINKKLGRLGGSLAVAEVRKQALQEQREARAAPPQPQPQQQRRPAAAPAAAAVPGRSPAVQEFLRKHPELLRSDGTIKKVALDAHDAALDAGHPAETPGYFQYIEQRLGAGNQAPSNGAAQPASAPGYAAPVTRGPAPGGDNLAPGTFRMTPKMRRLAEEQGVPPHEWAQNYVKLLKEGRITPIT